MNIGSCLFQIPTLFRFFVISITCYLNHSLPRLLYAAFSALFCSIYKFNAQFVLSRWTVFAYFRAQSMYVADVTLAIRFGRHVFCTCALPPTCTRKRTHAIDDCTGGNGVTQVIKKLPILIIFLTGVLHFSSFYLIRCERRWWDQIVSWTPANCLPSPIFLPGSNKTLNESPRWTISLQNLQLLNINNDKRP